MSVESGRGVHCTSDPRILSSQAIEAGAVMMAASAPCAAMDLPIWARLSAWDNPVYLVGCTVMGESGAAGRSVHAISIGLSETDFSCAPRNCTAAFKRFNALGLWSRASYPYVLPETACSRSHFAMPPFSSDTKSNSVSSTCCLTCKV